MSDADASTREAAPGRAEARPAISPVGDPIVQFEGVSKQYGSLWALKDVDLAIAKGEVIALLGPNGAGKTTAIHLMLGLLRPTAGQVTVVGGDPTEARTRRQIGAMLQEAGLPGVLKVWELIELFSSYYLRPLPRKVVIERANLVGLENRFYNRLSGGERKRVQFALAICGDPQLVYLDEPTANMDVESRRALHACIRTLAAEGRSILFATHYLEEADDLATRIVLLSRGRVLRDGTPASLKSIVSLRQASCRTVLSEEAVQAIPGVQEVRRVGDRLILRFQADAPVARELYQLDPNLADLTIEQADLEEAFLAILGKDAQQ